MDIEQIFLKFMQIDKLLTRLTTIALVFQSDEKMGETAATANCWVSFKFITSKRF